MRKRHTGQILDLSNNQPSPRIIPIATTATGPSTDFLWVDSQGKQSKGQTLSGAKQTFLKTKHHQRRKEAQLQRLKTSIVPFPIQSSQSNPVGPAFTHEPILYRGLEIELKQHFPSLGVPSDVNLDLYFHFCESLGDSFTTADAAYPLQRIADSHFHASH